MVYGCKAHDTLTFSAGPLNLSGNWGMKFSIWCWLLWKECCSMVLDEEYSERDGVCDKGRRLIAECERTYRLVLEIDNKEVERILHRSSSTLATSALVVAILDWLQKDWEVSVRHINRERNGVADSLATMGRDHGLHGSVFMIPPRNLGARVEEERHGWVSIRLAESLVNHRSGGLVAMEDPGGFLLYMKFMVSVGANPILGFKMRKNSPLIANAYP
ncbi:hypothetical protein V6N11_060013 [Hibiscus sabdariffa]|uniref:RNase H type-1 domain-containing protein n=1 Tax=Hibiscus sabdariffa TaxID=183260 RepID=A0ABR2NYU5_9ROSI